MDADMVAQQIRSDFEPHADGERAAKQQAYMKSTLPFVGLPKPLVHKIARAAVRDIHDADALTSVARELWDNATHREHLYAAMSVMSRRECRGEVSFSLAEHMIRTGQWWDITDEVAHRFTEAMDDGSSEAASLMRRWSTDENMWIRRVAIISQLGRSTRVDRELLTSVIDSNAADADFFIRKAIGWALRDVARHDPEWVVSFLNARQISPLSRREAVKHVE